MHHTKFLSSSVVSSDVSLVGFDDCSLIEHSCALSCVSLVFSFNIEIYGLYIGPVLAQI